MKPGPVLIRPRQKAAIPNLLAAAVGCEGGSYEFVPGRSHLNRPDGTPSTHRAKRLFTDGYFERARVTGSYHR